MLFSPPAELQRKVSEAGGSLGPRDLFIKRVAALGGDTVELTPEGDILVNGVLRAAPAGAARGAARGQHVGRVRTALTSRGPPGARLVRVLAGGPLGVERAPQLRGKDRRGLRDGGVGWADDGGSALIRREAEAVADGREGGVVVHAYDGNAPIRGWLLRPVPPRRWQV